MVAMVIPCALWSLGMAQPPTCSNSHEQLYGSLLILLGEECIKVKVTMTTYAMRLPLTVKLLDSFTVLFLGNNQREHGVELNSFFLPMTYYRLCQAIYVCHIHYSYRPSRVHLL